MFEIDNLLKEVIIIYFSFSILLYQLKLDVMFDENENFIPFGVGPGKTLTPYWLIILCFGILLYIYRRSNQ